MSQSIIKTGTFLYADSIIINIRIVQKNFRPGSGDEEDEAEFCNDLPGPWFEIQYGAPTDSESFPAGGGYYKTLEEAVRVAEQNVKIIRWD